jgi:Lrp/AsnC family transcriptional regulator for asnA, asnC and gidA
VAERDGEDIRAFPGSTPATAGLITDQIDRQIVEHLQVDGRMSFREIARHLGVAEGTVRTRAKRLMDSGALRVLAVPDPFQLGYEVLAQIFLKMEPGTTEAAIETLVEWPDVVYVATTVGRADISIEIVCRGHGELRDLVVDRIPAIRGVLGLETLIELSVHKFLYRYA